MVTMGHSDEELAKAVADAVHCTGWILNILLLGGIGMLVAVMSAASGVAFCCWDWVASQCGRKKELLADGVKQRVVYSLLFADPAEERSFNLLVTRVQGGEGPVVSTHRRYSMNLSGGYNEVAVAGGMALSKWRPRLGCFRTEAGSETQVVPLVPDRPTWLLSLCIAEETSSDPDSPDSKSETDDTLEDPPSGSGEDPSAGSGEEPSVDSGENTSPVRSTSPPVTRSRGMWFLGGPSAHEKGD